MVLGELQGARPLEELLKVCKGKTKPGEWVGKESDWEVVGGGRDSETVGASLIDKIMSYALRNDASLFNTTVTCCSEFRMLL